MQVFNSTEGLLVELSAVYRGLKRLERARGYRNIWCCPRVWLMPWELGKYRVRIVREDPSGSPGAFNYERAKCQYTR